MVCRYEILVVNNQIEYLSVKLGSHLFSDVWKSYLCRNTEISPSVCVELLFGFLCIIAACCCRIDLVARFSQVLSQTDVSLHYTLASSGHIWFPKYLIAVYFNHLPGLAAKWTFSYFLFMVRCFRECRFVYVYKLRLKEDAGVRLIFQRIPVQKIWATNKAHQMFSCLPEDANITVCEILASERLLTLHGHDLTRAYVEGPSDSVETLFQLKDRTDLCFSCQILWYSLLAFPYG